MIKTIIDRMMWLLAAGILYLIGIAIILALKPSFMFTEDGVWKEFGIGRNPNTHTWLPFWLFAILWALVSYILTVLLFSIFGGKTSKKGDMEVIQTLQEVEPEDMEFEVVKKSGKKRANSASLADGYYVLNRKATEAAGGIPKYVYLGRGLPE
jgi:hypothetical protein